MLADLYGKVAAALAWSLHDAGVAIVIHIHLVHRSELSLEALYCSNCFDAIGVLARGCWEVQTEILHSRIGLAVDGEPGHQVRACKQHTDCLIVCSSDPWALV